MTGTKNGETSAPPRDPRSLERKAWRRIALANLMGVIPINLYLTLNAELFAQKIQLKTAYALLPAAVYVPAYVYSRLRAKHLFTPIATWMASERAPSPEERRATIDHPRRLALMSLWCWIWALLCCFIVGEVVFVSLGLNYLTIVATVTLSALIACSLTYLVAEDVLRPLFAVALEEETTKLATVGVMPRLTLSWIVGSASYLIAIAILVFVLRPARLPMYVLGACVFGLAVGAALTIVGARSVARPLEHVRSALAKVGGGDLDVSVTVDDAGEIGQLQAGFNRMVSGLRERDKLKQLFDRHVGPDVARRAFDASGLGGAELDATVMFVDLIGSTSLAAERPPDSVLAMLNALFSAVVQEVGAEGGLVNQFQGDGALCIFGAPHEVPDHAARALRAATALRQRIVDLGNAFPGFDAAIGISSGHLVGGDVGTENRYEYTVIGDAANVAARLTDEAKKRPGRLLVSEWTVRSAGGSLGEWLECDELVLRGRRTPTLVFEPASL